LGREQRPYILNGRSAAAIAVATLAVGCDPIDDGWWNQRRSASLGYDGIRRCV
jgi:hypothetical protein